MGSVHEGEDVEEEVVERQVGGGVAEVVDFPEEELDGGGDARVGLGEALGALLDWGGGAGGLLGENAE